MRPPANLDSLFEALASVQEDEALRVITGSIAAVDSIAFIFKSINEEDVFFYRSSHYNFTERLFTQGKKSRRLAERYSRVEDFFIPLFICYEHIYEKFIIPDKARLEPYLSGLHRLFTNIKQLKRDGIESSTLLRNIVYEEIMRYDEDPGAVSYSSILIHEEEALKFDGLYKKYIKAKKRVVRAHGILMRWSESFLRTLHNGDELYNDGYLLVKMMEDSVGRLQNDAVNVLFNLRKTRRAAIGHGNVVESMRKQLKYAQAEN